MIMLQEKSQPEYFRFVAEDDEKCCDACKNHNNEIFQENDPDMPQLPIHPNCRCKLVKLEVEETENVKSNILQMIDELNYYENQLLSDFQQWKNDAAELLNSAQKSYDDFVTEAKIKVLAATASAMLTMIEKFNQTGELLKKIAPKFVDFYEDPMLFEMEQTRKYIEQYFQEIKGPHFERLNLPQQQLSNLPKSPVEAIMQGYEKVPDSQNWYHRHNGEFDNEKYINKKTGQEVIFDRYGNIVTSPENIGTFNYGSDPTSLDHLLLDVIPYWRWGNSVYDTTSFWQRVFGSPKK